MKCTGNQKGERCKAIEEPKSREKLCSTRKTLTVPGGGELPPRGDKPITVAHMMPQNKKSREQFGGKSNDPDRVKNNLSRRERLSDVSEGGGKTDS